MSDAAEKLFRSGCEFVAGAATFDSIPSPKLPEIAFAGRSNVGKSSLINALTHRKNLARVSQTPGATRQINFFRLDDKLVFADLPGYGFAQASKSLARSWRDLIFAYLRGRPNLRRVVLLIDARRGLMPADEEAMDVLDESAVSYIGILTKTDKLSPADLARAFADLQAKMASRTAAYPTVIATSAETGEGLEALRAHVAALAAR